MQGNIYGYVRVSTKEQNEDRQLIAMKQQKIKAEDIFVDKISGRDFERPEYKRLIRTLKKGDLLVIKSIDRLGRNYEEIIEQWRFLTKEKGIDTVVLDMPLLDTTKCKDLLGTFIADLVLQLLSYVSQNECDSIRRRQAEGIAAAKERGVKFGREPKSLPDNFDDLYEQWRKKEISCDDLAELCGMSRSGLFKKMKTISKTKSYVFKNNAKIAE